ncbi:hypothetical protein LJR289_005406 [Pseudoduganella sp. LjRoot289]|uniref:hypothetical protein n=1 Tax=Pseudoduganella sp. LjRoot289 TaxID=3342314 RepID=UPI003ECC23A7
MENKYEAWSDTLRRGALTGSVASATSALALAVCSQGENRSPFSAVNAVSHWLWGDKAARKDQPSMRYTLLGYGIHHASSVFWGVLFERWFRRVLARREPAATAAAGTAMAAVACFVDYQMTPRRLHPGYEQRLSVPSLTLVYAAFGAGLALGALAGRRR